MKKIIRILFVCLFFIALIFIGKNVLKDGKEREYIKSDKYYEENIENININEVNFKFLQVNEVANVNEAFYKKYDSYKEVVVEDNKNYDVFEKSTALPVDNPSKANIDKPSYLLGSTITSDSFKNCIVSACSNWSINVILLNSWVKDIILDFSLPLPTIVISNRFKTSESNNFKA